MDHRTLQSLADRILIGLADFYYAEGYKSDTYRNPDKGGIYENKLADRLGFKLDSGDSPPKEFLAATEFLAAQGLVNRIKRSDDSPFLGIWPTQAGLDRSAYLKLPRHKKVLSQLRSKWIDVLVSFVTTIVTILLAWLFGLIGIK